MELIVDRIEAGFAVCENIDRTYTNVSLYLLPEDVKEGDVITKDENGDYIIDADKTAERRQRIKKLLNSLWK